MNFLIEFFYEFIIDICIDGVKNKNVPKFFRYIFLSVVIIVFAFIMLLIGYIGIVAFRQNLILAGIFTIGLSIFFAFGSIFKYKKIIASINKYGIDSKCDKKLDYVIEK